MPTTFRQNSLRTPSATLNICGAVGVADDLHQAFAVAQVDEDHAAMVAAAVRPAHQRHGLAEQRFADQAAVGCSHAIAPDSRFLVAADALAAAGWAALAAARRGRAERLPGVQPGQFRAAAAFGSATLRGATTPIEMTYFSASSTLMRSAITSARGTIRKKPEVGFGVVGTYTLR